MLKNRIKSLINLIKDTEIEEIEVSSFWGAQKIRLSKKKSNQNIEATQTKNAVSKINVDFNKNSLTKNMDTNLKDSNVSSEEKEQLLELEPKR